MVNSIEPIPTADGCLSAGTCLGDQLPCPLEHECFRITHQCDGFWDCPQHGKDEFNCGKLAPVSYYASVAKNSSKTLALDKSCTFLIGGEGIMLCDDQSVHCLSVKCLFCMT